MPVVLPQHFERAAILPEVNAKQPTSVLAWGSKPGQKKNPFPGHTPKGVMISPKGEGGLNDASQKFCRIFSAIQTLGIPLNLPLMDRRIGVRPAN